MIPRIGLIALVCFSISCATDMTLGKRVTTMVAGEMTSNTVTGLQVTSSWGDSQAAATKTDSGPISDIAGGVLASWFDSIARMFGRGTP